MNIKIEHGVPITKCSRDGLYANTFRKMKKGDSFLIGMQSRATVFIAADRLGMKITTRKVDENHVRVWRVK